MSLAAGPEEVQMPAETPPHAAGRLDDDDYPAYTMGRAAEMIGATPGFLRAIGDARLITPLRSEGGHRRYSRYQLRIAARARELVDGGTPIEAACRIVILEDQLEEALRLNAELRRPRRVRPAGRVRGPEAGPRDRISAAASAEFYAMCDEGL